MSPSVPAARPCAGHEGRVLRRVGNAESATERPRRHFTRARGDRGEGGKGGVVIAQHKWEPKKLVEDFSGSQPDLRLTLV